jgi:hypothetical protein
MNIFIWATTKYITNAGKRKRNLPLAYVKAQQKLQTIYINRKSNPNITEWMSKMNFKEYNQLEAYYSTKLLSIAKNLDKKVTVWQGKLFFKSSCQSLM